MTHGTLNGNTLALLHNVSAIISAPITSRPNWIAWWNHPDALAVVVYQLSFALDEDATA